jgi:hypothetical protein
MSGAIANGERLTNANIQRLINRMTHVITPCPSTGPYSLMSQWPCGRSTVVVQGIADPKVISSILVARSNCLLLWRVVMIAVGVVFVAGE